MESLYTNNWPEDLKEVSRECFNEFVAGRTGYIRKAGEDGYPVWEETPPLTDEDIINIANYEKDVRIQQARNIIQEWQSELILETISDDNKESLKEWLAYINDLKNIDTSNAPDVNWPEKPE